MGWAPAWLEYPSLDSNVEKIPGNRDFLLVPAPQEIRTISIFPAARLIRISTSLFSFVTDYW